MLRIGNYKKRLLTLGGIGDQTGINRFGDRGKSRKVEDDEEGKTTSRDCFYLHIGFSTLVIYSLQLNDVSPLWVA